MPNNYLQSPSMLGGERRKELRSPMTPSMQAMQQRMAEQAGMDAIVEEKQNSSKKAGGGVNNVDKVDKFQEALEKAHGGQYSTQQGAGASNGYTNGYANGTRKPQRYGDDPKPQRWRQNSF
jgi:hypothetical protein